MSNHDPASDLSRLHREAHRRWTEVDPWTYEVLSQARALSDESMGAFDITVGARLAEWGFLPPVAGAPKPEPEATPWEIELKDGRVRFRRPLRLDLGGIAKGFAVDRAIEAIAAQGVPSALVNAGGDLRAHGEQPFRIAIRRPDRPGEIACEVDLSGRALATSGTYFARREGDGQWVSPLVNPTYGTAISGTLSLSVVAPTCLEADALTKILLARAPRAQDSLDRHNAEAIRFDEAGGKLRVRRFSARPSLPAMA